MKNKQKMDDLIVKTIVKQVDKNINTEDEHYDVFSTRGKLIANGFRFKVMRSMFDVSIECFRANKTTPTLDIDFVLSRVQAISSEPVSMRRVNDCIKRLHHVGLIETTVVDKKKKISLSKSAMKTMILNKYNLAVKESAL